MNIREDRSYINTEKHWFDRGYAKEDLYSLRLSFLYSEAERAANLQYAKEHSQEEFDRHFIRSNQMRSDEMAIIMETISRHFICLQYNEEDDIAYHSEQWDLFFWCNYFNSSFHAAGLSGRDYSYFTLSFNKAHTLEMRKEICERVLHLLSSHFQDNPHLDVAIQYSSWFDHQRIEQVVTHLKPLLNGKRCTYASREGTLLLHEGTLFFKPKYAKRRVYMPSETSIIEIGWQLGLEEDPTTASTIEPTMPATIPYEKCGDTHPLQLLVSSYLNGNLAIQMVTWDDGFPEPWATLTVNLSDQLLQKDHAFINTNADSEFPIWLIRHGLAIPTGRTMRSGFCEYPEYHFRPERLQELDPKGYTDYLKHFEGRCSA